MSNVEEVTPGVGGYEVDIGLVDIVASRNAELRHFGDGGLDRFSRKSEESLPGARSPGIN
jgi:hypothetical protein